MNDAVRQREAAAVHAREVAEDRGAMGQRVRFNARRGKVASKEGCIIFTVSEDWPLTLGKVT